MAEAVLVQICVSPVCLHLSLPSLPSQPSFIWSIHHTFIIYLISGSRTYLLSIWLIYSTHTCLLFHLFIAFTLFSFAIIITVSFICYIHHRLIIYLIASSHINNLIFLFITYFQHSFLFWAILAQFHKKSYCLIKWAKSFLSRNIKLARSGLVPPLYVITECFCSKLISPAAVLVFSHFLLFVLLSRE